MVTWREDGMEEGGGISLLATATPVNRHRHHAGKAVVRREGSGGTQIRRTFHEAISTRRRRKLVYLVWGGGEALREDGGWE